MTIREWSKVSNATTAALPSAAMVATTTTTTTTTTPSSPTRATATATTTTPIHLGTSPSELRMVDSSLMRETRPSSLRGSSAWISSEDLLTDGSSTDDDGDGACREDLSHLAEKMQSFSPIADNKMIWRLPNVFKSPIQCEPEIRKAGLLEVSSKVPQDLQHLSFTQHETTTPSLLAHSVEPEICWKPKRGSSFKAHQDLARKVLQYEAFVDRSQEDEKKL